MSLNDIQVVKQIDHVHITDQVYARLREKIVSREFESGARLDLDLLADQFEVSRTPIRDAAARLAAEGLIEIISRRGTYVRALTTHQVLQMYDVFIMMQLWGLEHGFDNVTREELKIMRMLVQEMSTLVDGDNYSDFDRFTTLNAQFHRLIMETTRNAHLLELYDRVGLIRIALVWYYQRSKRASDVNQEHDAILSSYESGDKQSAIDSLRAHLVNTKTALEGALGPLDRRW